MHGIAERYPFWLRGVSSLFDERRGRVEVGRQTFVASRCKDSEELPLNGRGLTKVGRN